MIKITLTVCLNWGERREGKQRLINSHFLYLEMFKYRKERGTEGNIYSHCLSPFLSFYSISKWGRKEENRRFFNSFPPFPSIVYHNISKRAEYKTPLFRSFLYFFLNPSSALSLNKTLKKYFVIRYLSFYFKILDEF